MRDRKVEKDAPPVENSTEAISASLDVLSLRAASKGKVWDDDDDDFRSTRDKIKAKSRKMLASRARQGYDDSKKAHGSVVSAMKRVGGSAPKSKPFIEFDTLEESESYLRQQKERHSSRRKEMYARIAAALGPAPSDADATDGTAAEKAETKSTASGGTFAKLLDEAKAEVEREYTVIDRAPSPSVWTSARDEQLKALVPSCLFDFDQVASKLGAGISSRECRLRFAVLSGAAASAAAATTKTTTTVKVATTEATSMARAESKFAQVEGAAEAKANPLPPVRPSLLPSMDDDDDSDGAVLSRADIIKQLGQQAGVEVDAEALRMAGTENIRFLA